MLHCQPNRQNHWHLVITKWTHTVHDNYSFLNTFLASKKWCIRSETLHGTICEKEMYTEALLSEMWKFDCSLNMDKHGLHTISAIIMIMKQKDFSYQLSKIPALTRNRVFSGAIIFKLTIMETGQGVIRRFKALMPLLLLLIPTLQDHSESSTSLQGSYMFYT